jgi:hypothetical protein
MNRAATSWAARGLCYAFQKTKNQKPKPQTKNKNQNHKLRIKPKTIQSWFAGNMAMKARTTRRNQPATKNFGKS